MESNQLRLSICSREETAHHKDGDYTHVLSLLDPERGYDGIILPRKAKKTNTLLFHDLDDIETRAPKYFNCIPPNGAHVENIIQTFCELRITTGAGILVHCEAGISRSTAAAIIGLCALGLDPEDAFRQVAAINEVGLPNRRMLRLAGERFKDSGTLLTMAETHRRFLFEKYGQIDPTEKMRAELEHCSIWQLWWAYLGIWIKSSGRTQKHGSDEKMLSRWKMKANMLSKRKQNGPNAENLKKLQTYRMC